MRERERDKVTKRQREKATKKKARKQANRTTAQGEWSINVMGEREEKERIFKQKDSIK